MTKKDVTDKLTEKGIEFDPEQTKGELENLLVSAKSALARKSEEEDTLDPSAKNLADEPASKVKKGVIDPKVGDLDVARSVFGHGKLIVEVVNKKKLKELEETGRIVGYKQSTKEASYRA